MFLRPRRTTSTARGVKNIYNAVDGVFLFARRSSSYDNRQLTLECQLVPYAPLYYPP